MRAFAKRGLFLIGTSVLLLLTNVSQAAQDTPLGTFYAITHNAANKTQSVFEIDGRTGASHSVFTLDSSSDSALKDVLLPAEIESLDAAVAAGDVTTINGDTTGVEHSIEGVWQIDAGSLLALVSSWRCDTPLSGCFGTYTFNRIALTEGEPQILLQLPYHQPLLALRETCDDAGTSISAVALHPTQQEFAVTLTSRDGCFAPTSYIVDYAVDPAAMTELSATDNPVWSPSGTALAYVKHETCDAKGCAVVLYTQADAEPDPVLVKEMTLTDGAHVSLAWMDDTTLIYSLASEGEETQLVWYDTTTQDETQASADPATLPDRLYTLENDGTTLVGLVGDSAAVGLPAEIDAEPITDLSSVSDVTYNSKYNDYLFANFDGEEVLVIDAALVQTRINVADLMADMPDEELINLTPGAAPPVYECTVDGIDTEKALIKEINAANESGTAATLCLKPGAALTLTTLSAPSSDSGDNYLPLIQGDITLVGYGAILIPEEGASGRLARVRGAKAKLTIIDMTLMGWQASEKSDGGVFRVDEGTLAIQDSTLTNNTARRGGVIFNNQGTVIIERSILSTNSAAQTGGMLDGVGTISITDSTLSHNTAHAVGGALYFYNLPEMSTEASLTRVTLTDNNSAQDGGALYFAPSEKEGGTLAVEASRFTQNTAAKEGGALYLAAGTTTLAHTVFESNAVIVEEGNGGAIYVSATSTALNLVDTTFENNLATLRGGAVYADHSPIVITGGLFTGNQVSALDGDGGAIFAGADEDSSSLVPLMIDGAQFIGNKAQDQGGAIALSFVAGHLAGSCLAQNSAGSGAAVWSNAPMFAADDNWWEAVPPVNSNVTVETLLTECPVADLKPLTAAVTGFKLIDASDDKTIAPLIDGDIIDLRNMPGVTLRIGIEITPQVTGSVVFELNGQVFSTDNTPEYRLASDWAAEPGVYEIKATPYTGADGSGIMGTPKMLTFTILDYLISEPVMSNGKTYTRATLDLDVPIYKDRDYVITDVDALFIGRDFIQAVNNDKELAEPNFMTFELLCDATLYIGYDTRLSEPPWLKEGWLLTNLILIASDTTGAPIRAVYSQDFKAGPVTLGSNYGVTDSYTYTVIAVPHEQCHAEE